MAYDKEFKARVEAGERGRKERWHDYHRLIHPSGFDAMTGLEFEVVIASHYETQGYTTTITQSSGDYGVDIIASNDKEKLAIQAKRYSAKVGVKAIQEVSSGAFYYKADKAIVITNAEFTAPAINLARKTGVELINGAMLRQMLHEKLSTDIPPFDLEKYKLMEQEIITTLFKAGRMRR